MRSNARALMVTVALVTGTAATMAAQQHRHQGPPEDRGMMKMDMEAMKTPWSVLNAFHGLLHGVRHPIMESGDFGPARGLADELAAMADSLARSTPPPECHGEDLAEQARQVAGDARILLSLVEEAAPDDTVKATVEQVHRSFQPLMMACRHHRND